MGQKLALGEVEDSQGFPEVKHSKYQNGFLTMDSINRFLILSLVFKSDEQKPRYSDLNILVDNQTRS
jgi:hypothetical protein